MQEGQAARDLRRLLGKNGLACEQQQGQVQERDAKWVKGDCDPSQGDNPAVLGVIACERVVCSQKASAVVKLLAVECLEGA